MNTDILAIGIVVIITGIVITAWRIRAAKDKIEEGLREKPVVPKKVEKSQIQIAIERLENKQEELSKRLDQILETQSKVAKPKAVKKKAPKTSPKKTVSKSKTKKT